MTTTLEPETTAGTRAQVILDSVSATNGNRLTTVEVTLHRFVLAEFNTHRSHARNSASSRAIPVEKQLEKVSVNPAWPIEWPSEQPGMQGGTLLEGDDLLDAIELFHDIHAINTGMVQTYLDRHPDKSTRLHKSLINRLLEPFMWHTIIATATEDGWQNFFNQRCSPLAQPEIRVAANLIRDAYDASEPGVLHPGEWHTPYISWQEQLAWSTRYRIMVSIARCARVSYLTHDGVRDPDKDIELYEKLMSAVPVHWSPAEHCATPAKRARFWRKPPLGNLTGWHQARHVELP